MFLKLKRKLYRRENRISIVFFVITMVIAICPLLSRYCINGHDLEYHLLRIESLKEGIEIGRPFLKVNTLFFGGAGYASSMFYSDIFMYFPALLRVLGFSIGASYHIFVASVFIICYLTTYYSVYKISLSKYAASIAGVLMTLCPYHMDDMLVRGACGEYLAFIFVPLALYGIYNVVFEDMSNPFAFGIGFAGLILTHPATCLLMAVFAFVVFLIFIKNFIKNSVVITRLLCTGIVVLLVTAYFWVPMLEQFSGASFYVSDNWTDMLDAAVNPYAIISDSFPTLGFILVAFCLPRFTVRRRDYPILRFIDILIAAAVIFTIGATNIMPWEKVGKYFSFLQFPWRMLIFGSVFLAVADSMLIVMLVRRMCEEKREYVLDAVLIAVVAICGNFAINHFSHNAPGYYDYSDDYYSYAPYTTTVIAGEWLPVTVTDREALLEQSIVMQYEDGTSCDFKRERACITAQISEGHEYVDVPFIYYKGYKAVLSDESGKVTSLYVSSEGSNGMCRVRLGGMSGSLKVTYKGTIIQYISYIASAVTLLILFGIWFFDKSNKKRLFSNARKAGAVVGSVIFLAVLPVSFVLTGCSVSELQSAAETIDKLSGAYENLSNPDDMVNYLKNRDEEDKRQEELLKEDEEKKLVTVNVCKRGYDNSENGFAICIDESSGEQVVTILDAEELSCRDEAEYEETKGLYLDAMKEEFGRLDEFKSDNKQLTMQLCDMLLCLEIYDEGTNIAQLRDEAAEYADVIFNDNNTEEFEPLDKYLRAAVLAKSVYSLDGWENGIKAKEEASRYFSEAEQESIEDSEPSAARVFAAAELYRLTGLKTYRSVVDATLMDVVPEGFSYEEPGYYGLFTYLLSDNQGSYRVCGDMMEHIFDKANGIIKEDPASVVLDMRVDDRLKENEESAIADALGNARVVAFANYASVCVEYEKYIQRVLCYMWGANLSGTDYTAQGERFYEEPLYFLLQSEEDE